MKIEKDEKESEKYWIVRRESFNLLRKNAHGLRTAPFIDDFVVPPSCYPEFLPKLNALLAEYSSHFIYTIAGHIGDGNFHIIPLMDSPRRRIDRLYSISRQRSTSSLSRRAARPPASTTTASYARRISRCSSAQRWSHSSKKRKKSLTRSTSSILGKRSAGPSPTSSVHSTVL